MKYLLKNFIKVIIVALIVKTLLLPWGAHPFDFWTFINTFQRNTLYGWNVFEYWNKGNLLIVLWQPLFSLYSLIIGLGKYAGDNLVLMHFLMKVPFLLLDLLSGFLVYKIVLSLYQRTDKAKVAFLLWFLNPIIYYVYGIHGHYDLLIPFSLILIIYSLLEEKRWWMLVVGLVIAISTKYVAIILLPLLFFYLIKNKKWGILVKSSLLTLAGLLLSYLQLFFDKPLVHQTLDSVLNLSSVKVAETIEKMQIPSLNLFSAFNFIFRPFTPIDNFQSPELFSLANQGLKISLLLILFHLVYRIVRLRRDNSYSVKTLILDMFFMLAYFLMLISNFQAHYISWLIPFIIILLFDYAFLLLPATLLSVIGFIFEYKNEIGPRTFLMDIVNVSGYGIFVKITNNLYYLMGAVIIFSLLVCLMVIIFPKIFPKKSNLRLSDHFLFLGALWLILIAPLLQGVYHLVKDHQPKHDLNFAISNQIHRGQIEAHYSESSFDGKTIQFNATEDNGNLFFNEYGKLDGQQKDKFVFNVVSKKPFPAGSLFNDCELTPEQLSGRDRVLDYKFRYSIPEDCMKSSGNKLILNTKLVKDPKASIYIYNLPVDYAYSPQQARKILGLGILGVVYLIAIGYFSIKILKKLKAYEKVK